jgi:hypothetical protein
MSIVHAAHLSIESFAAAVAAFVHRAACEPTLNRNGKVQSGRAVSASFARRNPPIGVFRILISIIIAIPNIVAVAIARARRIDIHNLQYRIVS